MYELTEEGKKYLKEGLPEINLIKKLKEKELSFEEVKKSQNFNIALQWAKKNNWIKIEKGILKLTEKGKKATKEKYETEEFLKKVEKGLNKKEADFLLKRNLIRKITKEEIEAKKLAGKEILNLTPELLKTGYWRKVKFKKYNVEIPGKKIYPGKKQPYNRFLFEVKQKIVNLGFKEMRGPLIETEFWNFDALFQPQNHSARDWTDTYQLKYPKFGKLPKKELVEKVKATHENGWITGSKGWGYKWNSEKAARLMPRAHDTAISPRYLSGLKGKLEIPGKYFSLVRCFRPDVVDSTHSLEFYQLGGFVIAENLTFKDLLGLLKMFAIEFAGTEEIKFYGDYYPFTEPSVQLSAKHPKLGWIEFGGAGIFREELTKPLGIDIPVIAWGLGVDRLAMFKLGIKDIRDLFTQDLKWLREKEVIKCQQ